MGREQAKKIWSFLSVCFWSGSDRGCVPLYKLILCGNSTCLMLQYRLQALSLRPDMLLLISLADSYNPAQTSTNHPFITGSSLKHNSIYWPILVGTVLKQCCYYKALKVSPQKKIYSRYNKGRNMNDSKQMNRQTKQTTSAILAPLSKEMICVDYFIVFPLEKRGIHLSITQVKNKIKM